MPKFLARSNEEELALTPQNTLRDRAVPRMVPPFQDDLCGISKGHPQRRLSRPSSNYTLSSQAAESNLGACALNQVNSREQREPTRPNTPVSDLDRDPKKTADDSIRSVRASASSAGGQDAERNVGLAEKGVGLQDSTSQGVGEKESFLEETQEKQVGWFQAGAVMIAETVSLGILSLPQALAHCGYVAGIMLIIGIGLIATYTGYVVYQLKIKHPDVNSFAAGMGKTFGTPGLWIGKVAQTLLLVFIMGAHISIWSTMMNTLTNHGLCTVVFMGIGAIVCFGVSMPRSWKSNSTVSMCSCVSIISATVIAMVAIGIQGKGVGNTYTVTPSRLTSFSKGGMAVSNIVLAYNSQIAYPTIISEMRNQRDFPKALAMLQCFTITFYVIVAVVIYHFAGQNVTSPALSSAPMLVRKIAFGIASPTIVVAGVIAAIVAAKLIYDDVWRKNEKVKTERSFRGLGSWYAILAGLWLVAWLIAESIPVFGQLISVIGSLFGTWFALGFCSMFWLWMNKQPKGTLRESYMMNWKKAGLACLNVAIILMSVAICVIGMYGSIVSIIENGSTRMPFSCANNADG